MPALSIDAWTALREAAEVENALRDGHPPPGELVIGSHGKGAIRVAAIRLQVSDQSLRRRIGSPECPGLITKRFGFFVDWGMYRPKPETDETEELKATIALYEQHGSMAKAAAAVGVNKDTIRQRIHKAAERGLMGTKPILPGFRIKEASRQLDADGNLEREWIRQSKDHGEPFSVPDGHVVKGISALTDEDGRLIQQWVKTKTDDTTADLVTALKEAFKEYGGKANLIPAPVHSDDSLMSIYPIADQHLGLLSWGKETGESFDLKIGIERLRSCITRLVSQSPPSKQAIIVNLGDWYHGDDQKNVTPGHGHQLDLDGRYFKILQAGVQLMMDIIELALQKHDTVVVRNIPGNHDPHAAIALTVALGAFYAKNPRVIVDDDPGDFFFHRFGATLIGATHGHKCKPDKMAMSMAVRCREDWGATKYHYMMHGHFHHEMTREVGDVRVEGFQTLAANDAYSASHGYNSGKSLNSITLHFEEGEIGRHRINIPLPIRRATKMEAV